MKNKEKEWFKDWNVALNPTVSQGVCVIVTLPNSQAGKRWEYCFPESQTDTANALVGILMSAFDQIQKDHEK